MESNVLATVLTSSVVAGVISSLLDIYYIQNISMCRNTEKNACIMKMVLRMKKIYEKICH